MAIKLKTKDFLQYSPDLYAVQGNDLEKCARLMASAFNNDPSIRYLLGGSAQGKNDWRYFYTVLKSVFGKSIMLSVDKNLNDLIVLFPPTLKGVPTIPFILKGGARLPLLFAKGLLKRSAEYEANCKRIKKGLNLNDSWYCMCFVVEPSLQNNGRGSHLIREVFKTLDLHKIPLYLETHKIVNVEIYKHFGFDLKDTSVIPKTNICQYGMLRQP